TTTFHGRRIAPAASTPETMKNSGIRRCTRARLPWSHSLPMNVSRPPSRTCPAPPTATRSEEHTSELQSRFDLVCRLLLEKKKKSRISTTHLEGSPEAIAVVEGCNREEHTTHTGTQVET